MRRSKWIRMALAVLVGIGLSAPVFAQENGSDKDWALDVGFKYLVFDSDVIEIENTLAPVVRLSKDVGNEFTAELEFSMFESDVNILGTNIGEQKQATLYGNVKHDLPQLWKLNPVAFAGLGAHIVDLNSNISGLSLDADNTIGGKAGLGVEYFDQLNDKLDVRFSARVELGKSDFNAEVSGTSGPSTAVDGVDNDWAAAETSIAFLF